jgi:exonuclease III
MRKPCINFTDKCGLKIASLNIRRLLNKVDEIQCLLMECKFDIFGICETFLDDEICCNEYKINGYNVITKSRNRHGGGVLLYIKDTVKFEELTNVNRSDIESLWIHVKCNSMSFALGMMYRPPSANNSYLNGILEQLDHVHSTNDHVMLMGDLNFNCLNATRNPLQSIEVLYDMTQLVSSPTRVTMSTSTLIDVIMSNFPDSHIQTSVYELSVSDHYLVYTVLAKTYNEKHVHKEVLFRNY